MMKIKKLKFFHSAPNISGVDSKTMRERHKHTSMSNLSNARFLRLKVGITQEILEHALVHQSSIFSNIEN